MGDIIELGFKWMVYCKDMSGLILGYGGVMDWLDGFVFIVVLVVVIVWIFKVWNCESWFGGYERDGDWVIDVYCWLWSCFW